MTDKRIEADAEDDRLDFSERAFTTIAFRQLMAEKQELIAALRFYQDAWRYKTNKYYGGLEWFPSQELLDDCGNRAREVLAKHGGE